MSFHTKVSSITLNFRSFCIERSPVKHTVRAAHNGAADRFENSPRFQRVFIAQEWRRLYTAAVFASFAWNNRIPVEFSWNWKETAVCRNRPIFLRSFVPFVIVPVTNSRRKDSRYDLYISTRISMLDTFSTPRQKFLLVQGLSKYFTKESDKSARENSSNHPCCSIAIRIYEREREVETSKSRARSKASSAPHQSLNRKRSRAVCRPIWRTSIFLLGYLPPHSTNHDSIFDLAKISSRSKDRAPLFKGGKTEQTGWTVADSRKIFAEWNAELRYPRIKGD